MKKFICFVSMLALIAYAFPQVNPTDTSSKKAVPEKSTSEKKPVSYTTQNNPDKQHNAKDRYNELPARRVVVGLSVGPTFNWMNWKNHKAAPEGYERSYPGGMKLGLRYGVNIDVDLNMKKFFYVSTGVLIEHTGGGLSFREQMTLIDTTTIVRDVDRRYKSIYFTIPTAITFRTPSFSRFIICGNIGLYHSFNLYSRYQTGFRIDPDAADVDKESINHVTTDWAKDNEVALFKESIFTGLGVEYVIKKNLKAKLYINYAQSLNNYFSKNATNSLTGVKERASIGSVEILFGISF